MKSTPLGSVPSKATVKAQLSRYFGIFGKFCASHPWEVIVLTVVATICVLSMSLLSGGKVRILCGLNKGCQEKTPEEEKADTFLMTIVNSLAVLYLYNQFMSLRKTGSKYLISIATLFTIFASFVFSSAAVGLFDRQASGLHEGLPFFLLLMDLSKTTFLAQFASKARTKQEVRAMIGKGISILGPGFSLDTTVEILIIGIGTISGVRRLETVCCFGCLSLLSNYLVFMTFFPAALALILEVCPHNPSNTTWQIDKLVRGMQQEEEKKQLNPVVQRVKLIMALGLVVVHIHSRFLAQVTGVSLGFPTQLSTPSLIDSPSGSLNAEPVPLVSYLWWKIFHLSTDQIVTLSLAIFLLLKYIFYDKQTNVPDTSVQPSHVPVLPSQSQPSSASSTYDADITASYLNRRSITLEPNLSRIPEVPSTPASVHSVPGAGEVPETLVPERPVSPSAIDPAQTASFSLNSDSEEDEGNSEDVEERHVSLPPRPVDECLAIFKSDAGPSQLSDEEILSLVHAKHIPAYKLEAAVGDNKRGVVIRRKLVSSTLTNTAALDSLPYLDFEYGLVNGACCENVIGYVPLPVGVAGPLPLDGQLFRVPMATTEGCLVASTNRGCRALAAGGGVHSSIVKDSMTRAPVVKLPTAAQASALKLWVDDPANLPKMSELFDSTSNHAHLLYVDSMQVGRQVYIRFGATTGDAMGMNMVSKGVEKVMGLLEQRFPEMKVLSISGNYCTDKKPSAINWILGRGKSVICEATIPAQVVEKVLKTTVDALIEVNIKKNLEGSAMAGSIGGFNAHAANIVAAIFIATGQDPAQVVGSSNCITQIEPNGPSGRDLYMAVTMPSLEVGTVGGGTILSPQKACLKMLGVQGPSARHPGENSAQLARVIAATVLAGELSLLSALAAGHLVRSHLKHNRSQISLHDSGSLSRRSSLVVGRQT